MSDETVSIPEAARFLGVSEDETRELANSEGEVPLEEVRRRAGAAALGLELADAREEIGRLSGRLEEVRATNLRLQKELRESVEERRRLTEEVLGLRAAAEERLMLMERLEHVARVEEDLRQSNSEVERLRGRRLLDRLLNR